MPLTVMGLILAGCADVATGPETILLESPIPDIASERSQMPAMVFHGSYSLETVNGEDLPCVFVDLPNPLDLKQEVLGGELPGVWPAGCAAVQQHVATRLIFR